MSVFPTGDLLAGLVGRDVCFVFHVCQSGNVCWFCGYVTVSLMWWIINTLTWKESVCVSRM